MASTVEISNIALARLGVSRGISSLDEDSAEASLMKLVYDTARDRTLADFPWPFARKTVSLSLLAAEHPSWEFVYRYPSDCLTAIDLLPEGGSGRGIETDLSLGVETPMVGGGRRIPYAMGADDDGTTLLTNEPGAVLAYTARITDTTQFPALFIDALAWRLAYDTAMGLTADPNLQQMAKGEYRQAVGEAMVHAFNQSEEGRMPDSEFMRVRV